MADIRICFSYTPTKHPWNGTNNFTRALREYISGVDGFTIVDELVGDYDLLFMNELIRGPESSHSLSEIRQLVNGSNEKKLVVRAVNLMSSQDAATAAGFARADAEDQAILTLLNMADFTIFQSAYQKSFFIQAGYTGKNHSVIHNGAASIFRSISSKAKTLQPGEDLILVSSAISTNMTKRQDILAGFSLVPGVKVVHAGVWPESVDRGKVEIAGILSHNEMIRLYERGHYVLHPAVRDVCPNSLIEGLCAGLPAIYNPGPGSGGELSGEFGLSLDENNLPDTITRARVHYERLATALASSRDCYSIDRAAREYIEVFRTVDRGVVLADARN